jgi:hypothetical protein
VHTRVSPTSDAETVIQQWLERSWKMHVSPPLVLCRLAQAEIVRGMGHVEIAHKLRANALMPLENFSGDVATIIKQQLAKAPTQASAPARQSSTAAGQAASANQSRTFKCFKCKKLIPMKDGQVRRMAVQEHRKICK